MNPFYLFVLFLVPLSAADSSSDKNPLHQLCEPCTNFFTFVKELNKNPLAHSAFIGICTAVTAVPPACAVLNTIGSAYINDTAAVVMCERILLCPWEGFYGFGHTTPNALISEF